MSGIDPTDQQAILARIRAQATEGSITLTVHGREEMSDDRLTRDDLLEAFAGAQLLENYPSYHKGPCCLIFGRTVAGRPLHIVCSTTAARLVIITVYEPRPPRWATPTQRGTRR